MTYLNLDDNYPDHPKIEALSDAADANQRCLNAWGRIDGCPACVTNAEAPYAHNHAPGLSEYVCAYECSDCGHQWTTSWKEN